MNLPDALRIAKSRCGSDATVKVTRNGSMYTATVYSMAGCASRYLCPVKSGTASTESEALHRAIY